MVQVRRQHGGSSVDGVVAVLKLAVVVVVCCSSTRTCQGYIFLGSNRQVANGGNFSLSWQLQGETAYGSNPNDEVRSYCLPGNEPLRSTGTLVVDHIDRWKIVDVLAGQYDLTFNATVNIGPFINMRTSCQFLLWRYTSIGNVFVLVPGFPQTDFQIFIGAGEAEPLQGHLSLANDPSEMQITWVSGDVSDDNPSVWYRPASPPSSQAVSVQAAATTYAAGDMCGSKASQVVGHYFRDPGTIYTARMHSLLPNTDYSYWYGTTNLTSPIQQFTSPKSTSTSTSGRILATADMGTWGGSQPGGGEWESPVPVVIQRMVTYSQTKPVDLLAVYGDLSYANGLGFVWERYFYRLAPIATRVPFHIAVGNHEYGYKKVLVDHQDPSGLTEPYQPSWDPTYYDAASEGECGVPVAKRFFVPQSSGSNGVFWYSHDVANIHMTYISTEHDLSPGSVQAQWLEQDLASVNRTAQPWVVVGGHRSLYNNVEYPDRPDPDLPYQTHGREYLDPLFFRYKVNLYLSGHYHNYVRTCALNSGGVCVQKDGIMYVTVGTGGVRQEPTTHSTQSWAAVYMIGQGFVVFETRSSTEAILQYVDAYSGEVRDTTALSQTRPTSFTPTNAAPSVPPPAAPTSGSTPIIVGAIVGAIVVVAVVAGAFIYLRNRRKSAATAETDGQPFAFQDNTDSDGTF